MGLAEELDRHFAQPQNLVKFQTVAELNQLPVCMAQRNDMYGFHRGMVESLKRSTTRRRGLEEETYEVIVFFVDLGVRETKLWQEIYQLPSRFSRLPQRSLRCRLWGVKPVAGGKSQEAK